MAADYPTTVAAFGQSKLHKTSNLGLTTLVGAISNSDVTINVSDATTKTTWPTANFVVRVEDELVFVTTRVANQLQTAVRGFGGTTAVSHASGTEVRVVEDSDSIQKAYDEIIAQQGWPGVAATFVSAAITATPYTALTTDYLLPVNAAGGAKVINLPTAVGIKGRMYAVLKTDTTTNTVTVDANASETIGGQLTLVLSSQGECAILISDGANWLVIMERGPLSKFNATVAPAVTDDAGDGYAPGSVWVDLTNDIVWICADATIGAAVWKDVSTSGSAGFSDYLRAYFNGAIDNTATVRATITATAGNRLTNIKGWAQLATGGSAGAGGGTASLRLTYNDDTTETVTNTTTGFSNAVTLNEFGSHRISNVGDGAPGLVLNPFPSLNTKSIKKAEILLHSPTTTPEGICNLIAQEMPA